MPMDFTRGIFEQGKYYLWGIFHGHNHPFEKTPGKKLNPLQKITYFLLLNILLPLQIITGILMGIAWIDPAWTDQSGGLILLGPMHTIGAFFFLSFLLVHIYLTTTGITPLDLLKQMTTGYGTGEKS